MGSYECDEAQVPIDVPAWVGLPQLSHNPGYAYLDRLPSTSSRRVMRATLADIAATLSGNRSGVLEFPWATLRYRHTSRLRALLVREQRAPATINRYLAALRGVLQEAWRLGQMTAEQYHKAADLAPVSGNRLPRGRRLSADELHALFDLCAADNTPMGTRDAAILAVLAGCGLRRAELASLDVGDYERASGELRVRLGKGRRERIAYALGLTAEALQAWVEVRGSTPGPLFAPVLRGGHVRLRRLTDQAVYTALQRRCAAVGGARFSPHDLRRTFITNLLDAGADLALVQQLAGHASVTTTVRYDCRGEEAKRSAAALVAVPFDRRRRRTKGIVTRVRVDKRRSRTHRMP